MNKSFQSNQTKKNAGSLVIWSNLQNFNLWLAVWIKTCMQRANVVSICPIHSSSSSCCVFICDTVTVHFTIFLSHLLPFSFSLGVLCTVNLSNS